MLTTAIFGGTFNPFHIGHYEMLAAVNKLDFVDEIWILPDNIPPHKEPDCSVEDSDRIEMCRIAAKDFKKAKVLLLEFDREGKSYTFDTVCQLNLKYPDRKFVFVLGGDMLISLNSWYRYDELIKKIGFLAFRRQGETDDFDAALCRLLDDGADIRVLPDVISKVSSTEIRKKSGGIKKSLLPPEIYYYIKKKGLYNV